MSRSLVVHQAQLTAIETALGEATQTLTTQIDDLLTEVERLTPGWQEDSDSHATHAAYQQQLRDGVERLTGALERVRRALATYREDARDIELENVAIIG